MQMEPFESIVSGTEFIELQTPYDKSCIEPYVRELEYVTSRGVEI